MFNRESLKRKRAFISGATGGIGKSIAIALAECGCDLFLTSTNRDKLSVLSTELSIFDINVDYMAGNLQKIDDINSITKEATKSESRIDIVINSAGIFPNIDLINSQDEHYADVMNINFRSAYVFSREFAKGMIQRKWGRIVNIGSSSAYNGYGGTSLYCASKHALLGFSRAIHDELKQYNVRTFCISPSSTQSKMGLATEGQDYSTFLNPDDIAEYVIFSISFDSNIVAQEILLKRMIIR